MLLPVEQLIDLIRPLLPPNIGVSWQGHPAASAQGVPECVIEIVDPAVVSTILSTRSSRVLAECFVTDRIRLHGDIEAIFPFVDQLLVEPPIEGKGVAESQAVDANGTSALARPLPQDYSLDEREQAKADISYHYDRPVEFWQLWLDPWLQYTCAYFPPEVKEASCATALPQAQLRKLALVCRKLELSVGERFLDFGCGWGGLIGFAAERYGTRSHGLTISQSQVEFVGQMLRQRGDWVTEISLCDFSEGPRLRQFDKAAGLGILEHVGSRRAPEYFRAASECLQEGGLFLNQAISWALDPRGRRGDEFLEAYVFPGGELLTLPETLAAAEEAGFEVLDVEGLREHYILTCSAWRQRLEAQRSAVESLLDGAAFRVFQLYLAGVTHAFRMGRLGVFQVLFRKRTTRRTPLRDRSSWHFLE